MDKLEAYLFLLLDSLMGTLVLPPHSELVFDVMQSFGGYEASLMISLAVVGSIGGLLVNYGFGKLVLTCRNQPWFTERSATFNKLGYYFARYAVWFLPLTFIPVVGTLLTVTAGIFQVRLWLFLILVTAGRIAYYSFLLKPFI